MSAVWITALRPDQCAARLRWRLESAQGRGLPRRPAQDEILGTVWRWVEPELFRFELHKRRFVFNNLAPRLEGGIYTHGQGSLIQVRSALLRPFVELAAVAVVAVGLGWAGGARGEAWLWPAVLGLLLMIAATALPLLLLNLWSSRRELRELERIVLKRLDAWPAAQPLPDGTAALLRSRARPWYKRGGRIPPAGPDDR